MYACGYYIVCNTKIEGKSEKMFFQNSISQFHAEKKSFTLLVNESNPKDTVFTLFPYLSKKGKVIQIHRIKAGKT